MAEPVTEPTDIATGATDMPVAVTPTAIDGDKKEYDNPELVSQASS